MRLRFLLLSAAFGCSSAPVDPGDAADGGGVEVASDTLEDSVMDTAAIPDVGDAAEVPVPKVDLDGDGLDDAFEQSIVDAYLPYLSLDPKDGCARAVGVYRLRPHPDDPKRLHLIFDLLLEKDCGASGHVGDDEVFGATIDPAKPAPAGLLAVRAISHQGTACEAKTICGTCPGLTPCTTATRKGKPGYPVVFYSKDKHGAYMEKAKCDGACFFTNYCTLSPTPTEPRLANAGEPGKPLITDLTKAGFITAAEGWTEAALMNFDPWGGKNFGGAGSVTGDLTDPAFLTPACP